MEDLRKGWIGVDVRGIAAEDMAATFRAIEQWTRAANFGVADLDVRAVDEINGTSVDCSRYEGIQARVDEAQRLLELTLRELGHTLVDDFRQVRTGEAIYARAAFAASLRDERDLGEDAHWEDHNQAVRFLIPEAPMSAEIAWAKVRSERALDLQDLRTAVRLGEVNPKILREGHGSAQPAEVLARIDALTRLVPAAREPEPFSTAETTFASLASGLTPDVDLKAQQSTLCQLTSLATQTPSPDSRRAVTRVYPYLDEHGQTFTLRRASRPSDPWLRRWAVDVAAVSGEQELDLVRDLVADSEPCVAVAFLDVLLARRDPRSMHAAARLLTHESAAVRIRATLLLGLSGSRGFVSDLKRAAKTNEDPDVSEALALAMSWLQNEVPRPAPLEVPSEHIPIQDASFGADDDATWRQAPSVRHALMSE